MTLHLESFLANDDETILSAEAFLDLKDEEQCDVLELMELRNGVIQPGDQLRIENAVDQNGVTYKDYMFLVDSTFLDPMENRRYAKDADGNTFDLDSELDNLVQMFGMAKMMESLA